MKTPSIDHYARTTTAAVAQLVDDLTEREAAMTIKLSDVEAAALAAVTNPDPDAERRRAVHLADLRIEALDNQIGRLQAQRRLAVTHRAFLEPNPVTADDAGPIR
jgi:hypothetical protein